MSRVLTVKQPWADLIMADIKDVENRTWTVPSTLPQWYRCERCARRIHGDTCPEWWTPETRHNCRQGSDVVEAVLHGGGRVEPDGPFPFRLGIHAAASRAMAGTNAAWDALGETMGTDGLVARIRVEERGRLGALLGFVTVTGCHHARDCWEWYARWPDTSRPNVGCSHWAEPHVYHWTLADPEPLDEPVPMKGMLGLWTLPEPANA